MSSGMGLAAVAAALFATGHEPPSWRRRRAFDSLSDAIDSLLEWSEPSQPSDERAKVKAARRANIARMQRGK